MWLSRVAVRNPVLTTMVVGMLMVLGLIGFARLPVDLFPSVTIPVITVIVPYPGATPEQVEQEVLRPVEDAVAGLPDLEELYGTARENVGVVVVTFEMGTSIREAGEELRDRVRALRHDFPEGVEEPLFRRVDPAAAPVMTLALSSELGPLENRRLAEEIVAPALERVDGVGAVRVVGGERREVRVELDLAELAALRLPFFQVVQQLGLDARDIPGGTLELGGRRLPVRARGEVDSPEALGGIVLRGVPQPVYLRDVARIVDGLAEQESRARVDGQRAVVLEVVKASGANTVAVCEGVREALERLGLPEGVSVTPVLDASDMPRDMFHEMERSLLVGALMAVLVVYLFMADWRSTLISALALPTSVITTFFFMWVAGFSLNMLTLVALSLAIGVLIDDAVVVREVIYRHLEEGEDPVTAALRGTAEVALAVLATTLSILAVFVPVGFMHGLVGQFFAQFGLTIAIAVSISLFVAFTLDPMLSARISRVQRPEERHPALRALLRFWARVDDAYREVLARALRRPGLVLGTALGLFALSLGMVALTGAEFIPAYDRSQFSVDVELAPASSLDAAEAVAERVESALRAIPEVTGIYTLVGPDGEADRLSLRVLTEPKDRRERGIREIEAEARRRLSGLPGLVVSVRDPPFMEGAQAEADIELEVRGADAEAVDRVAEQLRLAAAGIPGVVDLRSSYRPSAPELELLPDRGAAGAAGVSTGQLGLALRMALEGQVVGKVSDPRTGRAVDLRVRAREEDRDPRLLARNLLLLSPIPRPDDPLGLGTPVALGDLARLEWRSAPPSIQRHDRQRYQRVSLFLAGRPLSDVRADVEELLAGMDLPPGVEVEILGMAKMASDALSELLFALGLSVLFVYAVLASEFGSFVHPFTIMLSLPLAVVGAFTTVFLAGWSISLVTMLSVILLMGLVTKNAILLVDRANQLLAQGLAPERAMLEAGHLRLRPILMTSLAMILGMLPPALGRGSGSEIFQPMALPVIGGLVASTLLTLLVVPVVYCRVEAMRSRWRGRGDRLPVQEASP